MIKKQNRRICIGWILPRSCPSLPLWDEHFLWDNNMEWNTSVSVWRDENNKQYREKKYVEEKLSVNMSFSHLTSPSMSLNTKSKQNKCEQNPCLPHYGRQVHCSDIGLSTLNGLEGKKEIKILRRERCESEKGRGLVRERARDRIVRGRTKEVKREWEKRVRRKCKQERKECTEG